MRTFLVAVVAPNHQEVEKFLVASPLGPGGDDSSIDCWWVAEDDREDRSDNDSAIFIPRGSQDDMAGVISEYCHLQTKTWDEQGYPYRSTDVSGAWYTGPGYDFAIPEDTSDCVIMVLDGYSGQLRVFQGNDQHVQEAADEYAARSAKEGLPEVIYFFSKIEAI